MSKRQEVILRYFIGVSPTKFATWTQFIIRGRSAVLIRENPYPRKVYVGKTYEGGTVEVLKYAGAVNTRSEGQWVQMPKEMIKLIQLAIYPHEI